MVRPPKGERKRKTTTITVDPVEYAIQHLGTFIKSENARFAGQEGVSPLFQANVEKFLPDPSAIVDEATLENSIRP